MPRKSKWIDYFKMNDVIGKWTIIDPIPKFNTSRKEAQILCKCSCGTEKFVWALHLKNKNSLSCGCSNHDRSGENHVQFTGVGYISGNIMNSIKRRAAARNHKVNVNASYLNDLIINQNFKCAISNVPISVQDKTASLDRIDSTKQYDVGNVQWVHKDVNIMKNGYPQDYFIKFCHLVSKTTIEPANDVLQNSKYTFGKNNIKRVKLYDK